MIDNDTIVKNILFNEDDIKDMRKELETAFIKIDDDTNGCYYSGKHIHQQSPRLWELFNLLLTSNPERDIV